MDKVCAIILAAGEGTRMKSDYPKVLATVLFKPMVQCVIDAVRETSIKNICVVTGFKHEIVEKYLNEANSNITTVVQKERKGTAHAVMTAKDFLDNNSFSDVIVLGGDSPFIDVNTIRDSYMLHKKRGYAATVVSAELDDPFGYGRIVRDTDKGELIKIVEQKDATETEKSITEVNSGVYWFNVSILNSVIDKIKNENAQNEYYLPDAIRLLIQKGFDVGTFTAKSNKIVFGANNQQQLNNLNEIARLQVLEQLMLEGVDVPCKDGVMISKGVKFGRNTRVLPGTIINGDSQIGSNCVIGPNSFITDCKIGDNIILNSTYCAQSKISDGQNIKPFSVIFNKEI